MPISARLLGDDEEVLVDLHPHWVFLAPPAILTVVAVAVAAAVTTEFPKTPVGVAWVLAAMVAVPAAWLLVRIVRWLSTSVVVTTSRVILRQGVFRRSVAQLRLQRVLEVHYTQTLFERVIGSGRLVFEVAGVAGEDEPVVVDDVRRPKALQRVISARLEALAALGVGGQQVPPGGAPPSWGDPRGYDDRTPPHGTAMPPVAPTAPTPEASNPAPTPAPSVHQQLLELDDLRQRGIVTQAEFDKKKADLLSRL